MKDAASEEFFNNLQGLQDSTYKKLSFCFTTYRKLEDIFPKIFTNSSASSFSQSLYLKTAKIKDIEIIYEKYNQQYYKLNLDDEVRKELFKIVDGYVQYLQLGLITLSESNLKIKKEALHKVGPLALAIWYCDDGSFGYINQNAKIATYLSYEENKLIAEFLKEKYNIDCTINRDGKRYYIYFSVQEIKKFLEIVRDYIPKCMNYKLDHFAEENNIKINQENLKRRLRDKERYRNNMQDQIKRELILKQKRENQRKRMQNPEYREKFNEYYKNWKRKKQSSLC